MDLGLHLANFTWSGEPATFVDDLARTAKTAEDVGYTKLSVMDHVWQIGPVGPREHEMLEAYTALGFLAAVTERIELLTWVTAAVYREPGLLAKEVTTLDVLSKGRAWLGIGAAWNEEESNALGFRFPPLGERFERLEDTLRLVHGMWEGERGSEEAFAGHHVRAGRLLNSPQALRKPHPPIMIGGGGERKTLRLVAQYADACNVFGRPESIHHKFEVIREHCAAIGRDPEEIERTTLQGVKTGEPAQEIIDKFGDLSDAGAQHVIFNVRDVADPASLERLGRDVIPALHAL